VHGYYHATPGGSAFTSYQWDTINEQLSTVKTMISDITGEEAEFFRPPYGVIRESDMGKIADILSLVPVGWTIDTLDWSIRDSDELYEKTIAQIARRGKGIVLMHDIHNQSRRMLLRLLPWLKAEGYTVVSPQRLLDAYQELSAQ
jgi:peptidoglycan/xylan/chitin deacetylase (PgdA/CDA1 family)